MTAAIGAALMLNLVVGLAASSTPMHDTQTGASRAADASRPANRLAQTSSPYLLQHAHNPVDWYPWGEDALAAARREHKPIFLSIGYSTCYWCHVMERESFEDEATAAVLKRGFIAIKVDREERPDVDEIYMTACQIFTQLTEGRASGGWPLSVFLDPATLQPFHVGTYYPPTPAFGRPSFTQLLEGIENAWKTRHDEVVAQAAHIGSMVRETLSERAEARLPDPAVADRAVASLVGAFDRRYGGFGGAPKFPHPPYLTLLEQAGAERADAQHALQATLDAMALGGMRDQVGGGFHRYSVDAKWLVPHFEKMLYDNALLASLYASSVERTRDRFHERVLRTTLEWVLREMTSAEGAFHSAQDAEVAAREGGNYLWTPEEVRDVLEKGGRGDLVSFALRVYGLDGARNFKDPHHPEAPPANVLFLAERPDALAAREKVAPEEIDARLDAINALLLARRNARPQPLTDDKTIAAWTGLMIAGFADAGRVLHEQRYVAAAQRAAEFVLTRMRSDDGLHRLHRAGVARGDGFLEDYAFVANGLLAVHRATGDDRWLHDTQAILDAARVRFRDGSDGGWYDTLADQSELFVRTRSISDGAVPSGNSMIVTAMLELFERTGNRAPLDDTLSALGAIGANIEREPLNSAISLVAVRRAATIAPDQYAAGRSARPEPAGPAGGVTCALEPALRVPAPDATVEATLSITIPPGMHINAHDPGDASLVGLAVELLSGDGLELAVDFPHGTPWRGVRIHSGVVAVPVRLRRRGDVTGTPRVAITWQACTEEVCLRPATVELGVER